MSQSGNNSLVDSFSRRHIGITDGQAQDMAVFLGYKDPHELLKKAVPDTIQDFRAFDLPPALSEADALEELAQTMSKNVVKRSLLGSGYFDTLTPAVIQRNILENPSWYTQYTPYQAEIAQGRLEALVNYQTMIGDLTGLSIANASLLDEATGAAEAMVMAANLAAKNSQKVLLIASDTNPQTLAVVQTRAKYLGIEVLVQNPTEFDYSHKPFAVMTAYPGTTGEIPPLREISEKAHKADALSICVTDLMALILLESPGALGADIAVGNSQRFGVPLGYGGPHAGFIATKPGFERKLPGRIVGVSKDIHGKPALRLALATREQHIRRDKATSNICTAQVLLAIMAGMYAVYHGPQGLRGIANKIHTFTRMLATGLTRGGVKVRQVPFFDTIEVQNIDSEKVIHRAEQAGFNLRSLSSTAVTISFDEKSNEAEVLKLLDIFGVKSALSDINIDASTDIPVNFKRTSGFLQHPVFNSYHCEADITRYIKKLERRDLSLTHAMIPLGSCTMKLNATSELLPVTWPTVNGLHPFAPRDQAKGYTQIFNQLESYLAQVTGFDAVSLQPNSGAQGEYAGLLAIRRYQEDCDQQHRNICLIPTSAHGTNPASAVLAGMKVIGVKCDDEGNINVDDLRSKAEKHRDQLSAMMVTYPSTHGVFEESIKDICQIIHENGGQVYMDGANLQAQIGVCRAGDFGPDVCHLNLHKTFCIPHGGGGPGMGPIAVKSHLAPYLPDHPVVSLGFEKSLGTVSAAPWGSPSILPISWMYIRMMGSDGLAKATSAAILSANYVARKLKPHYDIVYTGRDGLVAHECIIDLKPIKKATGITETDIAKRLMDYGFHAPTVSWPVPTSMMIEPTESEPKAELDRFIEAMISIKGEIDQVAAGKWPQDNNPVKCAPHTAEHTTADEWAHPYSRSIASFPLSWVRENKFWPYVGRIDDAYGDRNFNCSCPPWGEGDA